MDYVTRQFINLTKKFRKDLRFALSKLNASVDENSKAIGKSAKASHVQQLPPTNVIVNTNFPESVQVHQNADDATADRQYKHRSVFLSALSLIALVFYATLVYLQYREMIKATSATEQAVQESRLNRQESEKSLDATIKQFHLEQRGWINISFGQWIMRTDTPLAIPFTIANVGKTPVKRFSGYAVIEPLSRGQSLHFGDLLSSNRFSGFAIVPNAPQAQFGFQQVRLNRETKKTEPINPTADIIRQITAGDTVPVVHGEIVYVDIFGESHKSRFCFYGLSNPQFLVKVQDFVQPCIAYNDSE
jgi:hypothetical protein